MMTLDALVTKAKQNYFGRANDWINFEHMEVYVRICEKEFMGRRQACIVLANLKSPDEYHRTGQFARLIKFIRVHTSTGFLYVENVFNDYLADHLRTHGWTQVEVGEGDPPSFIIETIKAGTTYHANHLDGKAGSGMRQTKTARKPSLVQ